MGGRGQTRTWETEREVRTRRKREQDEWAKEVRGLLRKFYYLQKTLIATYVENLCMHACLQDLISRSDFGAEWNR